MSSLDIIGKESQRQSESQRRQRVGEEQDAVSQLTMLQFEMVDCCIAKPIRNTESNLKPSSIVYEYIHL